MSLASLLTDAVGMWRPRPSSDGASRFPDVADAPPDTRRLIRNRRYCRVLTNKDELPFDDVSLAFAWQALQHDMALVPGGDVHQTSDTIFATNAGFEIVPSPHRIVSVDSIYVDRDCVTNTDFARFVQSDGYGDPDLWPAVILPNVLQFSDSSGQPGPKYWVNGNPPPNKLDHPVVGISWYEASAFATWAGKRLPSSAEWQRAGTWPKGHSSDGTELHFPWGNGFDPAKANVWASGLGDTVAVKEFDRGRTPNGVRQLVGNVWEWVDTQFEPNADESVSVLLDQTMAEIRGGAFDTYFQTQATCQFHTGQPLLFRGHNVGFRCCVSASEIPNVDRGAPRSSETV